MLCKNHDLFVKCSYTNIIALVERLDLVTIWCSLISSCKLIQILLLLEKGKYLCNRSTSYNSHFSCTDYSF